MRGFFAILLASLLLSQSTSIRFSDLAAIDDMIEHAQYHKEAYGDSWFTFFQKHLGSESEMHLHHEHEEKHQNLPNHEQLLTASVPFVILTECLPTFNLQATIPPTQVYFTYVENYSYTDLSDIFQPPRLV